MIARAPTTQAALAGRDREMAALWRCAEAALAGRAGIVMLSGEPGIGKSRLLGALAARAEAEGMVVLRGGASDAQGMPPYLPFLEALGEHIRRTEPDVLRQQAGPMASVLAVILPELALRAGGLPPGYPLPPEQARLRLFEAAAGFLAAIAAENPLLLVLDDLHWADPAGLDLLCYLLRHHPQASLLIAGAYRDGEAAQNPALERALAELNRLRVLTSFSVTALTPGGIADAASTYLGAPLAVAAVQRLFDQSEGNPFFAEELLRAWLEDGTLALASDGSYHLVPSTAAPAGALPSSISSTVRRRLAHLPPETVTLLRTAAVAGRSFDTALLARVTGREPETVEEALQPAVRARVIMPEREGGTPAGTAIYRFNHDTTRETLYEEVTPVRRQRLHGFLGRALEALTYPPGSRPLANLAFHFARSGDRARGTRYAMEAARQAMRASAHEEALQHYRTAADLLDSDGPDKAALLSELGRAALLAGAPGEAVPAFEASAALFREAGDIRAAARALHDLGQAWWRQEALDDARRAFEMALSLLQDAPGSERVLVLADLAGLLAGSLHQQTEGTTLSWQAFELAEQLQDRRLLAAAARTLGNLLVRSNDLSAGIRLLERALDLAVAEDDPVEAAECCGCLATAYFWSGSLRRSRAVTERRLDYAGRCHDPYQLRHIDTWLAVLDGCQGDLAGAEHRMGQAETVVTRLASPEPGAFLDFTRGALAVMQGDYERAQALLEKAIDVFRAIGPAALVWYLGWLAYAQAAGNNASAARTTMVELESLLASLPAGSIPTAEPLACLAEAALRLGDTPCLARYYPRLLPFAGQFHDFLVDRLLGEIEALQGNTASASARLDNAEAVARREHLLWELARILEARSGMAAAEGGRHGLARARTLLSEAAGLYEQIGNTLEARRLRSRAGRPGGSADRPALPAGLTHREADVLRLLAAGHSNREIAAALVLSEKTVEHHLSSVYAKIDADNRAAAAAFALRHGIA